MNFDLNNDGNSATDRTPGLGRDTLYLPTTVSLDPRVTRNLQFTERVRLQFIGEAFNALNHGNISGVRTTQFSRSTSAQPPLEHPLQHPAPESCNLPSSSSSRPTDCSGRWLHEFCWSSKVIFVAPE